MSSGNAALLGGGYETLIVSLEAQEVISQHRGSVIVVTTMSTNFEWSQVSTNPAKDLMFSGTMGESLIGGPGTDTGSTR